jgi:YidC/Oxa1 family membrane protein insertase
VEKRFAAFLAVAFLILAVNAIVIHQFAGPQPRAPAAANREVMGRPAEAEAKPGADALDGAGRADAPSAEAANQPASSPVAADAETPQNHARPQGAAGVAQENGAQQWITIGSVDVNDGYRMLVTLTDRGAAVERVELSSPRYSDADDRTGYLGHLALEDLPDLGGARIRVIGAGTPAARAGLQAADTITALNDDRVGSADDLHRVLRRTRPNQEVRVTYLRNGETRAAALRLRRRPLEVMRPERENIEQLGSKVPANIHDPPSLLLTAQSIGGEKLAGDRSELAGVDLREGHWEVVERTESSVAFRRLLPARKLEFTKRFALSQAPPEARTDPAARAYDVQLEIEIRNVGEQPQTVAYQLDGPNGLPVEGWWFGTKVSRTWSSVGLRDMAVRFEDRDPQLFGTQDIVDGNVEVMGQGRSLMFAGIDTQYFAAVIIPLKTRLQDVKSDFITSRAV